MTEHAFVRAVHNKLPSAIKIWKIIDDFHGGVSDAMYFGLEGQCLFVEYKYAKELPVRPATIVAKSKLPPLQQDWFQDLHGRSMPVAVVVGCGLPRHYKAVWFDDPRDTLNGITNADFASRLITKDEVCSRISQRVGVPQ